jgi:PKD repeat protein
VTAGRIGQRIVRAPLAVQMLVILSATLLIPFGHVAQAATTPPHVLMVVMENTSYEQIVGNSQMPFVNAQVAANGSVSTTDLSHPSEPNYLGMTSGSIYNNPQDLTPQDQTYPGPQFTDQLATAGIAWKAYMEDMPVACDLTDQFGPGNYDVNHDPFMYYNSVRTNAAQCNRVVPYPQLTTDLNSVTAPSFIWVTPNLINDMHDGTPAQGDAFLQGLVTQVRASSWWTSGSRIVITWDEGVSTEQVLTLVIGSAHGTAATGGSEFGNLRGLEEAYGVGLLGHAADTNVGDILPLLTGAAPPPPSPSPSASPSPSPPPPSVPPPSSGTRGIFRYTSTDFAAMHAAGFNASTDGGVQDNLTAQVANGIAGMVWVAAYNNVACTQTLTNTQIAAMVQANVTAGHPGLRYQIGDEPTANGCNAAPVYTSITQAVHAVDASAKTWADIDQFQVGNPVQSGVPMKGTVDIIAFDVYPCQSGPCDYSAIDSAVQQIHAANVTNWEFILQDFSASPWRWPTPAEIQAQFDHWKNQGAIGYWVFAWDYLGQQMIQQTGNVAAVQSINSQAINSSPSTVTVGVSADATTGTAPLAVNFTSTPSGGVTPYTYAWTFGDGTSATSQSPSHTYTVAGNYSANLTVTDANGSKAVTSALSITVHAPSMAPGASAYTAQSPNRILDTRSGGTLGSGQSLNLTVAGGTTGVPATATGVVLNVTVTNTTAPSFLTVWPAGATRATVSNLNWMPGETRANLVNVPVGAGGQVSIYNGAGSADVVVDEEGYFAAPVGTAGGYNALPPARLLDTRLSAQTMNTGSVIDVQVLGAGGVPASGVSAVVLNATATNTASPGFLTLYPSLTTRPLASNLNWAPGWTVPNRVIVKVGANGKVSIYNGQGSADAVIDVSGYFSDATRSGELFTPLTPVRVLDTRSTGGTVAGNSASNVQFTGHNQVPSGATAVFVNSTVTNTTASSVMTVYPGPSLPTGSDLNWVAGETIPNLTLATLSSSGAATFYNYAGSTDLVLDLSGYFS